MRSARVLGWPRNSSNGIGAGEAPSIEEYIDRHPELADRIREVFPAMAMMEDVAVADASLAAGAGDRRPPGGAPGGDARRGWATSGSSARSAGAGWAWSTRPSRSRWAATSR